MISLTQATCPYCGHVQNHYITGEHGKNIILCDNTEGGCDTHYAVFWHVKVETKSYVIGTEADRNPETGGV